MEEQLDIQGLGDKLGTVLVMGHIRTSKTNMVMEEGSSGGGDLTGVKATILTKDTHLIIQLIKDRELFGCLVELLVSQTESSKGD